MAMYGLDTTVWVKRQMADFYGYGNEHLDSIKCTVLSTS